MDFAEIETITQGALEIMNPISEEKLLQAGKIAGLGLGKRVLDIGCGNGTALSLWHKAFGITGTGIEVRPASAARARNTLAGAPIEIRCVDASVLVPKEPYDVVAALGTSFIFGGAEKALAHLAEYADENGSAVLIGDRFWQTDRVLPEFAREWTEVPTAYEFAGTARELGFTLSGMITASSDEWDAYESSIWNSALEYIDLHENEPAADELAAYLEQIQDEYLAYGREYMGWGLFVFRQ
ncbi:MAG: methyltransferase domain-containing protein [Methanocalculaceae archaeon]|jgi:SAM-dependent methyltransferase|nr:methyltransferase domain-containing protein [Methanocalculaceae archaeon]